MGGPPPLARFAATVAAVCGVLGFALPTTACADAIDAAPALSPVDHAAAAFGGGAVEQVTDKAAHEAGAVATDSATAPAAVRDTAERALSPGREDSVESAANTRPVAPPTASRHAGAAPVHGAAAAPAAGRHDASHGAQTTAKNPSPPHGWKPTSPARSPTERAGTSRTAEPQQAAPRPERAPQAPGLADSARLIPGAGLVAFVALLLGAMWLSHVFELRPFATTTQRLRAPVLVTQLGPPG